MTKTACRFALLAALTAVAGCTSTETPELPPCPRVSLLSDLSSMTRFRPGAGHEAKDVQMAAEITSFHGSCRYDANKKLMTVSMRVGVDARRGPAADSRKADIAYFVAVPAFYPDPKAKAIMPIALDFAASDNVQYVDDVVDISFPIKNLKDLPNYEVFLGLQLNPQELDYNRHPNPKFPK